MTRLRPEPPAFVPVVALRNAIAIYATTVET
jgi:hypothetical protein